MAGQRCGDPALRPNGVVRCTIPWMAGMVARERHLASHSLLATVQGRRLEVSPEMLVVALVRDCTVNRQEVRVEVCALSDFLVTFANWEDCTRVLMQFSGYLKLRGCRVDFCRWSKRAAAESSSMQYLVKLGLDGLPSHAWEEGAVRIWLLELHCHLLELLPPADARTLEVMAWAATPNDLPKEVWLTFPDSPPALGEADVPAEDDVVAIPFANTAFSESPPAPPTEEVLPRLPCLPSSTGGGGSVAQLRWQRCQVRLHLLEENVRGLNNAAKRGLVEEVVVGAKSSVVCLQESKLESVSSLVVVETCGSVFDCFAFLPAENTRGGVIIAWRGDVFQGTVVHIGQFSVSVLLVEIVGGRSWYLTSVYGPQSDEDNLVFLEEMAKARLNQLELREMYLFGRRYTWSNEQERPTLVKLDRVFVSKEWEEVFPEANLLALSTSGSDHCPLLMTRGTQPIGQRRFKFENFWARLDDFSSVVEAVWQQEVESDDPYIVLYVKMARIARKLRTWGHRKIGSLRLQLQIANEVILRFDIAQESRNLTDLERRLRAALKSSVGVGRR